MERGHLENLPVLPQRVYRDPVTRKDIHTGENQPEDVGNDLLYVIIIVIVLC